jgi:chromosome segregation ATPase
MWRFLFIYEIFWQNKALVLWRNINMPTSNSEQPEQIINLISRIDERVKTLIGQQKDFDTQINVIRKDLHSLSEKIAVVISIDHKKEIFEIKNKVYSLEVKTQHHDNRWSQIFDSLWKIALMCIASYILYKLGLQK